MQELTDIVGTVGIFLILCYLVGLSIDALIKVVSLILR